MANIKLKACKHLMLQSHQVGAELLKTRVSDELAEDSLVEVVEMFLLSFICAMCQGLILS